MMMMLLGQLQSEVLPEKKNTIGSILICTPFVMHDSGIFARRYNEAMAGLKKKTLRGKAGRHWTRI
jgi:hypothetical protein